MKKALFLLAISLSFSILAEAEPKGSKRVSLAEPVRTKLIGSERTSALKITEGVKIERRAVDKPLRDAPLAKNRLAVPKQRAHNPQKSQTAHLFSVYDAWTTLDYDNDGDGFYSEFTVSFDVDFSEGYADVYADMYLSKDGGPWMYFNTTDVFTIHGDDAGDVYHVSTLLNYNFPTGYYDVLIDVYEVGYADIVATATPNEFSGLFSLPLEDYEHEALVDNTAITYVASDIYNDFDLDGFYTNFSLEFDIETNNSGRLVYTEIDLINVDTLERVIISTNDFQLGSQTEIIDIELEVGYLAGWYDVEIRLVDSYTGEVLVIAAQEFSSLLELPLESQNNDNYYDTPGASQTTVHVDAVVVHESGGGSLTWLIGLGLLAFTRKRKAVN